MQAFDMRKTLRVISAPFRTSGRRNGRRYHDGAIRHFVATFSQPEDIMAAVKSARNAGYTVADVQTPFPIHGIEKAMGLRPTRLPLVCLLFALAGAAAKFWFQMWTSATSWPVNVGGKPLTSVPAFIPVTFEITVLFAGLGTVAALLFRTRLRPGKRAAVVDPKSTDDTFVLVLLEDSASFDPNDARALFAAHNALYTDEFVEEVKS